MAPGKAFGMATSCSPPPNLLGRPPSSPPRAETSRRRGGGQRPERGSAVAPSPAQTQAGGEGVRWRRPQGTPVIVFGWVLQAVFAE